MSESNVGAEAQAHPHRARPRRPFRGQGHSVRPSPRVQLARFNEGDHGLLSTRTGRSSTSTGCRATVRVATRAATRAPLLWPARAGWTDAHGGCRAAQGRPGGIRTNEGSNSDTKQECQANCGPKFGFAYVDSPSLNLLNCIFCFVLSRADSLDFCFFGFGCGYSLDLICFLSRGNSLDLPFSGLSDSSFCCFWCCLCLNF